MTLSAYDLAQRLRPEWGTSDLKLDIDDLWSIRESLKTSHDTTLRDLAAAARRNASLTCLTLTVDQDVADRCAPLMNVLLRDLSRTEALHLSFVAPAVSLDLGIVTGFFWRYLYTATHLTSISLRILGSESPRGQLYWSVFKQLTGLRSFSLHSGHHKSPIGLDYQGMIHSLSVLEHLEKVNITGFLLGVDTMDDREAEPIKRFLRKGSLKALHVDHVYSGIVLQNFTNGLLRSAIEHLHLSVFCRSHNESTILMGAITTCTEFRTLSITSRQLDSSATVGGAPVPRPPNYAPMVGGATVLLLNERLTVLRLCRLSIDDTEVGNMSLMLARPCCVLEKLEIVDCDISLFGIYAILSSLATHTTIRDILIDRSLSSSASNHNYHAETVFEIVGALVTIPLRSLRLLDSGNFGPGITREWARAQAQRLTGSVSLETIEVDYMDEESRLLLDSIGRLNAAGRLYLLTTRSRKAGIELLGKVSNNLTDAFIHLRENPSLCLH